MITDWFFYAVAVPAVLIAGGRKAARGRDVQAMIDADLAFHRDIYEASNNPLIMQITDQHWRHLKRVMGAVLQTSQQRDAVWDEHQAIADAIAAGQADEAAGLIADHGRQASRVLAQRLTQVLLTASGDKP